VEDHRHQATTPHKDAGPGRSASGAEPMVSFMAALNDCHMRATSGRQFPYTVRARLLIEAACAVQMSSRMPHCMSCSPVLFLLWCIGPLCTVASQLCMDALSAPLFFTSAVTPLRHSPSPIYKCDRPDQLPPGTHTKLQQEEGALCTSCLAIYVEAALVRHERQIRGSGMLTRRGGSGPALCTVPRRPRRVHDTLHPARYCSRKLE
jgi:hypothetical protein